MKTVKEFVRDFCKDCKHKLTCHSKDASVCNYEQKEDS